MFIAILFALAASSTAQNQYSCDFEKGLCSFLSNDRNNKENWKIGRGKLNSKDTGPSIDHTLGNANGSYLFVNVTAAKTWDVKLQSVVLKDNYCVRFFYHMYGADIGNLTVQTESLYSPYDTKKYFVRSKTQGDRWKEAFFSVVMSNSMKYRGYRVVFCAKHESLSNFRGHIAIDDVEMKPGKCPYQINTSKPEFRVAFENVTKEPGVWQALLCEADGAKPLTYKWYNQDENEITEDIGQPIYAQNGDVYSTLHFMKLSSEHEGSYMCTARNSHGLASKVFHLRVPPPSGMKPEFRVSIENVTKEPNVWQALLCEAEGEKPLTYTWYNQEKKEITEENGQPVYAQNGDVYSTLHFMKLSSEHEGSYTCTARNTHGLASKVFHLKVSLPSGLKPEFRVPIENVTKEPGVWQALLCEADGEKPLTYRWYNQDGKQITEDSGQPIYAQNGDVYSTLHFNKLGSEHQGSYTCNASNSLGVASKKFYLRVSPPSGGNDTDIDQGNVTSRFRDAKVLKYTTRSVTFNIITTGPAQYIEVKYREGKRASNTTTVRLDPVPGNNYTIGNLVPSGFYIFQFRTVPSKSSDWSREYNVTLLPNAPDVILQNVGNRNVRLQWFAKTDDSLRGTIDRHQIKYYKLEMVNGNNWSSNDCAVTIEIPSCVEPSYTILGLSQTVFYQIEMRAHTKAGYGEPWTQKIHLPSGLDQE